ncbi:Uncharacterised protein [Mycobacteroides abscessus subsp. abscessus]|nr:Uncharacterised protein [Mycobacteroides abscessus subsp. abscessus]SKX45440.1 Uncharacterised protein [Mycobacteroides abscessus subsp. abscessus]SKX92633.1 Uncharacterised protein [Mycobacteroides abscessus subsp. abscessus]
MPSIVFYCENTSHGNVGKSRAETSRCQHRDRFVTVCTFKIANFAEMTGKVDASNCNGSQKTLSVQTPWLDATRGASRKPYSQP